jgi:hypothetical protein
MNTFDKIQYEWDKSVIEDFNYWLDHMYPQQASNSTFRAILWPAFYSSWVAGFYDVANGSEELSPVMAVVDKAFLAGHRAGKVRGDLWIPDND